jgi:DNA-binding NarL/FixJ family response regulator
VIILYEHPLLGEGLERLLRAEADLEVELVHVDSLDVARGALTTSPDVVILERCAPVQALDLLQLAPSALFIDVGLDAGPSWAYHRDELSPQPEDILRAITERPVPIAHPSGGAGTGDPSGR